MGSRIQSHPSKAATLFEKVIMRAMRKKSRAREQKRGKCV